MTGLPRGRQVIVRWSRFKIPGYKELKGTYEAWLNKKDEPWERSIYIITGKDSRPLYIGKATGKKNPGFSGRYYAALPAVPALVHGTIKFWYVGQIDGKPRTAWYEELESELIARESSATGGKHPCYNTRSKRKEPDQAVQLRHLGEMPRFYHRRRF